MIHVERAAMDDLPAVWEIEELVTGQTTRRAGLLAAVEKRCLYVAKQGFTVYGYAIRENTFFEYPIISRMVTHPHHRRQGVARALIAYLEKTNTADRLFASAGASNEAAKQMFQVLRYRRSGMVYNVNPGGETEIIYVKMLF